MDTTEHAMKLLENKNAVIADLRTQLAALQQERDALAVQLKAAQWQLKQAAQCECGADDVCKLVAIHDDLERKLMSFAAQVTTQRDAKLLEALEAICDASDLEAAHAIALSARYADDGTVARDALREVGE